MAKQKVEKDTSERWTVTYSDLMNLLLILFIILYCSSQLDAEKAQQMSESLSTGFSTMEGTAAAGYGASSTASPVTDDQSTDAYWVSDEYDEFYKEIVLLINERNLQDKVDAKLDDTGVIISFKDNMLFETGSSSLNDNAKNLIDQIGSMLGNLDYSFILIEGHTDSDPIFGGGKFIDNMDLSSSRAGNVWRELVKCGLPPENMASIGYGEYRPVAKNDTAENKTKNRRVVISILKQPFAATTDLVADDLQNGTNQSSSGANSGSSPTPSQASGASPNPSSSENNSKSSSTD